MTTEVDKGPHLWFLTESLECTIRKPCMVHCKFNKKVLYYDALALLSKFQMLESEGLMEEPLKQFYNSKQNTVQ